MKIETEIPPTKNKENSNKLNEQLIEGELNVFIEEIINDDAWLCEDTYKHYLRIFENIDFNTIHSQKIWELNQKALDLLLRKAEDPSFSYGSWLDSDIIKIIEKSINLEDSKKFYGSLEILYQIEDYYANFISDPFKTEGKKYPIENLIKSLNEKTKEKKSNLFLSSYIRKINEVGPSPYFFFEFASQESFKHNINIEYIGEGRFANISSTVSNLDFKLKISKKSDHNLVESLVNQKNELEKKLELHEKKDFLKEKIKNEIQKISKRLEGLMTEENIQENFRKVKASDQNDIIDERLFGMIWATESLRVSIEEKIGVKLEKFDLPEQAQIISFLKSLSNENAAVIKNFSDKYNYTGFRTFLSVEHGGEKMGNKILTLGNSEKLPEGLAKKIFAKYGEIINIADNIEQEVKKIFGDKDIPNGVLNSVKETLLKRGAKMLSDLGDKVLDPEFKLNEVEVFKELDEIKEETIILGKSYYELYWEGIRVSIEDITTIKETPTGNLTEEQKDKLLKIYEKGRPKVTYESKEHLDFLKKEFKKELNDKDISVNEICFNDETIIIALVDKKDKDNLYVGGLTFVDDVKNAVVAEATLSHLVEKFKDKNIRALVDSKNPLLKMYQKRFGFKIIKKLDREDEIKDNGGQIYVEIEKLKEENKEEGFKKAA